MPSLLRSAGSALVPRSTLDGRAIAGAVVGSVVGFLLILLCISPFVLRKRREWRNCRLEPALQAEMGEGQSQSPGGSSSPQHPQAGDAKRLSADPLVPDQGYGKDSAVANGTYPMTESVLGNGHSFHQTAASEHKHPHTSPLPPGVSIHQGLPSPVSSPFSTSRFDLPTPEATKDGQAVLTPPADKSTLSSPDSHPTSRYDSVGTPVRENTRELSFTDSYAAPTRVLTGISSTGISPTGITAEPETFEQPSQSPSHRHFPHISGSIRSLIHARRPSQHRRDSKRSTQAGTGDGTRSPSVTTTEALTYPEVAEPPLEVDVEAHGEAWSYYHDPNLTNDLPAEYRQTTSGPTPLTQTITPKDRTFSRQTSLINKRFPPGPGLQRTDSLPIPTIVSDIQNLPLQFSTAPSGNPMEMMNPTNDVESNWRLKQDLLKIDSPPPVSEPSPMPTYMAPLEESSPPYIKPELSPGPEHQFAPGIEVNGYEFYPNDDFSDMIVDYQEEHYDPHGYDNPSDLSTPPPSSGPSTENTPSTQISDAFTASPSPRPDINSGIGGQLASSPRSFPCDQCHRVFDQIHKLNHHKRYHDRPHECPHMGCSMKFGTKTHLDRHINDKHMKTRKFYCTQSDCPYSRQGGKSFPRKDNWRRHMLNKHRISPEAEPEFVDDVMPGIATGAF
ncbi:hypothetical protein B0H67DRAFT_478481 [Lasiosphaeris hirsuta]|uniref:C2H2-type domain-containing protein n=1 Tax=Lasiosphaeris hirsuta TaxID=260670 RepID=A0AA40EAB6_9PEZI|nr:hypothetical protein B0H67DRAFT_478481 [Lasiosphaeris hirsuta]